MSKRLMKCLAVAVTTVVGMNQIVHAQTDATAPSEGLTVSQRAQVVEIVDAAKNELSEKLDRQLAQILEGQKTQQVQQPQLAQLSELIQQAQSSKIESQSQASLFQGLLSLPPGDPAAGKAGASGSEFDTYLKSAFAQAKRCDDLERFRKVMRNIAGTGDGTKCCNLDCGLLAPCDYSDGKGGIDPNKLFKCEYDRLEQAEKLARFRKVLKRLMSGDDCCEDKCTETKPTCTKTSYYAPSSSYYAPSYRSVVVEQPVYYHPVCFE